MIDDIIGVSQQKMGISWKILHWEKGNQRLTDSRKAPVFTLLLAAPCWGIRIPGFFFLFCWL